MAQTALALYFFATGTRTPYLALLSLRRPRNLAPIALGYAALALFALIVGDPAVAILALAPAPLIGPELARFARVRSETVGALVAGTALVSFVVLNAAIPGITATVTMAIFAFVVGAAIANSIPTVRDTMLPVLDGARYLGLAVLFGLGVVMAGPSLDLRSVGLALAVLILGGVVAAIGAALFRGDPVAAALGAGSRDPAVAIALAGASGLVGGAAIPLAYAVVLLIGVGLRRFVSRRV